MPQGEWWCKIINAKAIYYTGAPAAVVEEVWMMIMLLLLMMMMTTMIVMMMKIQGGSFNCPTPNNNKNSVPKRGAVK